MGKTIFHKEDEEFEIIEATQKAGEKYGTNYGFSILRITDEHINALKEGKMLATDDGEYTTFILHKNTKLKED